MSNNQVIGHRAGQQKMIRITHSMCIFATAGGIQLSPFQDADDYYIFYKIKKSFVFLKNHITAIAT